MIEKIKNTFKEILNNSGKILGISYIYVIIIGILIGLYYVSRINEVAKQKIPGVLPDTTQEMDLVLMEAKNVPSIDLNVISIASPELVEKGKTLFQTSCASCHGETGQGNGPGGVALNPPPRNFTSTDGWKNSPLLSGIYKTLEEGIPGSGMISYNFLTPEDRFALAHYIRETFLKNAPKDTPDELSLLDATYNLSKVQNIPAQIPVKSAMIISSNEAGKKSELVYKFKAEILNSSEPGAELLRNNTSDVSKAITVLMNDISWKNNQNQFVSLVVNEVKQNGFSNKVFSLTSEDWNVLFNYVNQKL
ncbi:MAG TPA: cytochrome c [Ignavibacteriaceae bacterium]|nr:cytochrome c [Ignavibacteriaceae bacterium]